MSKDLNKTDGIRDWIYHHSKLKDGDTITCICDGNNPTLEEQVVDQAYHYVKNFYTSREIIEGKDYLNRYMSDLKPFDENERQFSGKDMIEAYLKGFSFHEKISLPKGPVNLKRKKVLDVMKQLISFAEGLPVFQIRVTYRARFEDIKNYIEEDSKTMNTEWTQYYGMTPKEIMEKRLEKYSLIKNPDAITEIAFMQCIRTSDITYEEAEKILDSKIKNAQLLKIELPQ